MGVFLWLWSGIKPVLALCSAAGALRTVRATLPITVTRITADGAVTASATTLYWLHSNPSGGNWVLDITDDDDGDSAIVFDDFGVARESQFHNFDPPIPFANGIYIKTLTNITSILFGYE